MKSNVVVGRPVKVYVSIPCPECNEFFEIEANRAIGLDHLFVECPRCGYRRIVNDIEHLPHRVIRED